MTFSYSPKLLSVYPLFVIWIIALMWHLLNPQGGVLAQRIKEGCYDAFAVRCQEEQRHTNDLTPEAVRQWEAVCLYLAREVFPTDDIALDVARHAPYLNSVNADSTWCSEIRQAYPHCLWCAR